MVKPAATTAATSSTSDTTSNRHTHSTNNNNNSASLSFTSPYNVSTLDQIPTPLLKLLVVLGPTLRTASGCVDILLWRSSSPRQSILVVLLWILGCLFTWQLLAFGLPALVLYKLANDWLSVKTSKSRREALEKARHQQRLAQQEKLKRDRYAHEQDEEEEEDERIKQLRQQQEKEEQDELLISRKIRPNNQVSLDDTLEDLANVNIFIDHVVFHAKRVMVKVDGTKNDTAISVLSVLLYVWPVWILVNWLLGAHVVVAIMGAFVLISPSPWFKIIVLAVQRNTILKHCVAASWAYGVALITTTFTCLPWIHHYKKASTITTTPNSKTAMIKQWIHSLFSRAESEKQKALKVLTEEAKLLDDAKGTRSEMIFQFEVFENQRWWLGVKWTTNMMPSERGPWTDNQLKPIPSKEEFELPEPTVKTTQHTVNGQVIKRATNKVWSWADGDWWVDMTGELQGKIDQNGWEYGNNAWKQLSGVPGMQTFTRRRRWCRRARLVEREVEELVPTDSKKKDL